MTAPALFLPPVRSTLSPTERRLLTAGVAAAHVLALWGLLQGDVVRQLVREQAPLVVSLLTLSPQAPAAQAPAAPPLPPPPHHRPQPPLRQVPDQPTPAVATTAPPPVPALATVVGPQSAIQAVAAMPAAPAPAAAPVPPAATAPPAPAAPPSLPPAPKAVSASALRYVLTPAIEVPLASRRLGESGTVLLRVVFDTQGHAKQVSVLRSSGFARLDAQAVIAMRQARIAPYLDEGQAVEVVAQAPLVYELE